MGISSTALTRGATSVELLLFHREQDEPFAVLPFPEHYRIGNVYSMIVFKLNIQEFEYAYRVDGPYEPERGLIYDKAPRRCRDSARWRNRPWYTPGREARR